MACGRLIANIYVHNHIWDYVPGLYLIKQAGGKILNEEGCHIGANSEEALEIIKESI